MTGKALLPRLSNASDRTGHEPCAAAAHEFQIELRSATTPLISVLYVTRAVSEHRCVSPLKPVLLATAPEPATETRTT